jgi:hypothetical protein
MRHLLSTDEQSGTTRFQTEAPAQSYLELLQADDFEVKHRAVKAPPMATVSWSTADVLRNASNLAFAIEAHSRGLKLVGAKRILSGTHYESGKRKHRSRKQNKSLKQGQ